MSRRPSCDCGAPEPGWPQHAQGCATQCMQSKPVNLTHPRRGPWALALAALPAGPTWPEPF